jgi:Cu2+-exporting ATPase
MTLPYPKASECRCFHCGEPLPETPPFFALLDGQKEPMCCAGCKAVAEAIYDAGLKDYYKTRTAYARKAEVVPEFLQNTEMNEGVAVGKPLSLYVDGMTCAACAWLIERYLKKQPGVQSASVSFSAGKAGVVFDVEKTTLGTLTEALGRLGFQAYEDDREKRLPEKSKDILQRLGVAALFTMQVMMCAGAIYLGAGVSGDSSLARFLALCTGIGALPVVTYCAMPFYRGAFLALKARGLSMDVPITLALILAYSVSWVSYFTHGSVFYFDSASMFVFFLLIGRFFEGRAREKTRIRLNRMAASAPPYARLLENGDKKTVRAKALVSGNLIRILPGEAIPADVRLLSQGTMVDESLLTGESLPVIKKKGDVLYAGTVNHDIPIEAEVITSGAESRVSTIARLAEEALLKRPHTLLLADRASGIFVFFMLLVAMATALFWSQVSLENAMTATLAVLVASCPCALALATPVAVTVLIDAALRKGLLLKNPDLFEEPRPEIFVFDKTGTLTEGTLRLQQAEYFGAEETILPIAQSLALHSAHPVAKALLEDQKCLPLPVLEVQHERGGGVYGFIDGLCYYLGNRRFIAQHCRIDLFPDEEGTEVLLASCEKLLGRFLFVDHLRKEAKRLVEQLQQEGAQVLILSGDTAKAVQGVAKALGVQEAFAAMSPEAKYTFVENLKKEGRRIAMVGDGINDAPALALADCSFTIAKGADLAKLSADVILTRADLFLLKDFFVLAKKTKTIIRQNISWAIGYNLLAIPLAASGLLLPWIAAIGMSTSSLLVTLNALRVRSG